jgi:uncharacterized membrane protein YkgB
MDSTTIVVQAINGWLENVAGTITPPALKLAGALIFQTPSIPDLPGVQQVWTLVAGVADVLLVLALMWGGVLIMSSGTFEHQYTTKRLLPRLLLAAVMVNASLAFCRTAIAFDNAMVTTLVGANPEATLWAQISDGLVTQDSATQLLSSLVAIVIAIFAVLLVVVYLARDFLLIVGTVVAPLSLATLSVPSLAWLSSLWFRAYLTTLFVQVAQAALLGVGLQVARHPDALGLPALGLLQPIVLVTLLYLSLRLPFIAYGLAFGQTVTGLPVVQSAIGAARAIRGAS